MAKAQAGKLLYHLTALSNIPSIAKLGLLSRQALEDSMQDFRDSANPEIIQGRKRFELESMVPFHFFTKNPFDYAVINANPTEDYAILTVERSHAEREGWRICPSHPLSAEVPEILSWKEGFSEIRWDLIDDGNRDYSDQDCKLACMAEALSPSPVPWEDFFSIVVANEKCKDWLLQVLTSMNKHSTIFINTTKSWFPRHM